MLTKLLQEAVGQTLRQAPCQWREEPSCPAWEVGISVVSEGEMAALNTRYRGIEGPTDVLSFSQWEDADGVFSPPPINPEGPAPLGDIVIAIGVAQQQATRRGHSLAREMVTLTIHGTLHLWGYDHATPAEQRRMQGCEAAVQEALPAC